MDKTENTDYTPTRTDLLAFFREVEFLRHSVRMSCTLEIQEGNTRCLAVSNAYLRDLVTKVSYVDSHLSEVLSTCASFLPSDFSPLVGVADSESLSATLGFPVFVLDSDSDCFSNFRSLLQLPDEFLSSGVQGSIYPFDIEEDSENGNGLPGLSASYFQRTEMESLYGEVSPEECAKFEGPFQDVMEAYKDFSLGFPLALDIVIVVSHSHLDTLEDLSNRMDGKSFTCKDPNCDCSIPFIVDSAFPGYSQSGKIEKFIDAHVVSVPSDSISAISAKEALVIVSPSAQTEKLVEGIRDLSIDLKELISSAEEYTGEE